VRTAGKAIIESLDPVQIEADYERAWMMLSARELEAATGAFGATRATYARLDTLCNLCPEACKSTL
jgi:hypothetical protein